MLCDDLEGWDGGMEGDSVGKGSMYAYSRYHVVLQQNLTQHCKAIILQLTIKKKKETNYPPASQVTFPLC